MDAGAAASNWTNNNMACVYTWLDLNYIKELNETFDNSPEVTMNKLRFWNEEATPEARKIEAMNVAIQLAKMFTGLNFAKFEAGKDFSTAVNDMTDILIVADKTVSELSLAVDENYNFFGEVKV